jgi:type III secretory pathway component EscT
VVLAETQWILAGLSALRLAPSGVMLSMLSRGALPAWLGLGVSVALAPALSLGSSSPDGWHEPAAFGLVVCAVRELCLGAAFACTAALPWLAFGYVLRAAEQAGLPQPEALSRLYLLAALALCVGLGAPRAYLVAWTEALRDVPVGQLATSRADWLLQTGRAVQSALELGLTLGLPLWISLWLIDLCVGLVARAFGAVSEGGRSPLRAGLALLVVGLLLAPLASRAPELMRASLRAARGVVVRLSR